MTRKLSMFLSLIVGIAIALPYSGYSATYRPPASSIANDSITSAKINDGTIVNADVSSSAAINASKVNFNGVATTFPSQQGTASSTLFNNGSGTLSWAHPLSLILTGYATSTTDITTTVSVDSNDVLMIWSTFNTSLAGGSCDNFGKFHGTLKLKQSTMAATTTVDTVSAAASSADTGCSLKLIGMFTATTTETVNIEADQYSETMVATPLTSLMYQLLKK